MSLTFRICSLISIGFVVVDALSGGKVVPFYKMPLCPAGLKVESAARSWMFPEGNPGWLQIANTAPISRSYFGGKEDLLSLSIARCQMDAVNAVLLRGIEAEMNRVAAGVAAMRSYDVADSNCGSTFRSKLVISLVQHNSSDNLAGEALHTLAAGIMNLHDWAEADALPAITAMGTLDPNPLIAARGEPRTTFAALSLPLDRRPPFAPAAMVVDPYLSQRSVEAYIAWPAFTAEVLERYRYDGAPLVLSLFHRSCDTGWDPAFREFLLKTYLARDGDPDVESERDNLLIASMNCGDSRSVGLLMMAGADVDRRVNGLSAAALMEFGKIPDKVSKSDWKLIRLRLFENDPAN